MQDHALARVGFKGRTSRVQRDARDVDLADEWIAQYHLHLRDL